MKTSSKISFMSGVIATLGAMSLVYLLLEDTEKTPKQLIDDGKHYIKKNIRKTSHKIDNTIDDIEEDVKAVVKEVKANA